MTLFPVVGTIFYSKETEKPVFLGSCPSVHFGHQSPVSTSKQSGVWGRALGGSALCVVSWGSANTTANSGEADVARRDFPGGPVAKTLSSWFDPWSQNWIPHAATKDPACLEKDQRSCGLQLRPGEDKKKVVEESICL